MQQKKSRLIIFTPHFYPESFRVNDLIDALSGLGFEMNVITGTPNYPKGEIFKGYRFPSKALEKIFGARVYRVPIFPRGKGNSIRLALNYFSYLMSASIFSFFFLTKKLDHIFVFQLSPISVAIPALVLSKIKQVPSSIWIQDLWPESLGATNHIKNKWILSFAEKICSMIYRQFDQVFVQSPGFASILEGRGVNPSKITFLPNWAEKSILQSKNPSSAPEVNSNPESFKIVFTGNLGHAQDLDNIIEAAYITRNERDIQWYFVGDGSYKVQAQAKVNALSLEHVVHFLGSFPSTRMPEFFAASDALLVSLKADPIVGTTIPSKLQAYMASGKPILGALDGEGAKVISDSNSGLVARAGDPQMLARSVIKLNELSQASRIELGDNGRRYFLEHFEQDKVVAKLVNKITKE